VDLRHSVLETLGSGRAAICELSHCRPWRDAVQQATADLLQFDFADQGLQRDGATPASAPLLRPQRKPKYPAMNKTMTTKPTM
jgi:hypothetical protein